MKRNQDVQTSIKRQLRGQYRKQLKRSLPGDPGRIAIAQKYLDEMHDLKQRLTVDALETELRRRSRAQSNR